MTSSWSIWPSKAATLAIDTMAPRSPLSVGSLRLIAVAASRMIDSYDNVAGPIAARVRAVGVRGGGGANHR